MASATSRPQSDDLSSTLRSLASLALVIHLLCVAVVLASNCPSGRRSPLQTALVRIFACYTQLLDFDPQFTPYYYTLGRSIDDDAWLEIDLYPSGDEPLTGQTLVKTLRLPEGGANWLAGRRRYFALAKLLAKNADPEFESEDATSEIARSVGAWAMRQTQTGRAVVRCMRRMSQPFYVGDLDAGYPADRPTDLAYQVTVYEADVWMDEDRQVQAQKRASRLEVAPRQTGTRPAPAAGNRENP